MRGDRTTLADRILRRLKAGELTAVQIADALGVPVTRAGDKLLELKVKGLVERREGGSDMDGGRFLWRLPAKDAGQS